MADNDPLKDLQARIKDILEAESDDFFTLSKITGLSPKQDFVGANLQGVNLRGADLGRANFCKANLNQADLRETDLNSANLISATLIESNLSLSNLRKANLSKANLSRAILSNSNRKEIEQGLTSLKIISMAAAGAGGFAAAKAIGRLVVGAAVADGAGKAAAGVAFRSPWLRLITLGILPFGSLLKIQGGPTLAGVTSKEGGGADLSRANLSGANLSGADFRGTNLEETILTDTHLNGTILSRSNLSGANLSGALITGTALIGTMLDGANLTGANLSGSLLNKTSLSNANVDAAQFKNTLGLSGSIKRDLERRGAIL